MNHTTVIKGSDPLPSKWAKAGPTQTGPTPAPAPESTSQPTAPTLASQDEGPTSTWRVVQKTTMPQSTNIPLESRWAVVTPARAPPARAPSARAPPASAPPASAPPASAPQSPPTNAHANAPANAPASRSRKWKKSRRPSSKPAQSEPKIKGSVPVPPFNPAAMEFDDDFDWADEA